jgi:hypothetical protein
MVINQPIATGMGGARIEAEVKEILQREGWENKKGSYVTKSGEIKTLRSYRNPNHPYEKSNVADRRNKVVTLHRWGFESEPKDQY